MLNPECLDPREVLAHLNALGYTNITAQQLKEFLHDLKKLIKYEQKLLAREFDDCDKSTTSACSECSCEQCNDNSSKISGNDSCESLVSECSTSDTLQSEGNQKSDEEGKKQRNIGSNVEQSDRPTSSFIRPWNLYGGKEGPSRNKKRLDPVRLYHYYKNIWNRLNIPGEKGHSELRWVIRSRMIGQQPHPRVSL